MPSQSSESSLIATTARKPSWQCRLGVTLPLQESGDEESQAKQELFSISIVKNANTISATKEHSNDISPNQKRLLALWLCFASAMYVKTSIMFIFALLLSAMFLLTGGSSALISVAVLLSVPFLASWALISMC